MTSVSGSLPGHNISASASAAAHNMSHVLPARAAHVTTPSWNKTSFETPTTFLGQIFQGVKLFGEAVAVQSEQSDPDTLRWDRFGSLAAYAFSVYGISTFFVALILNRTTVIASSGAARARAGSTRGILAFCRRSPISQDVVLALFRLSAVVILASQVSNVLVTLGVIGQNMDPVLTCRLSRWIPSRYFQYDPAVYALDRYMKMPRFEVVLGPTTDMLWPVFLAVSYSLFVETFAAAIKNQKPFLEGGLTLFELSLAIQEMSSGFFFLREHAVAKRPSEQVLVICLFSLADQISNQLGAIFYANKYRLVPSTVISSLFVWYFCTFIPGGRIFTMPSEIALTYFALVMTLAVTSVCGVIFLVTVLTKGARVDELNFANFFADDHPNNEVFSQYLGLDLSQDFYTAAINLGMVAVTQAGKSSYFMAYNYVPSPRQTWLEQSLWEQIKSSFDASKTPLVSGEEQTSKILHFLSENEISGYNNIISKPSKRLINGSENVLEHQNRVGSIRLRCTYLAETFSRFGQLVIWGLLRIFYYWPKNKLFGKTGSRSAVAAESEEQLASRRKQAPAFLRHLITKKNSQNAEVPSAELSNADSLSDQRALIEWSEDESPDFELGDELDESELESDAEVFDLVAASPAPFRANETATAFSSAISELMTPETVMELLEDRDILHDHLHYEYTSHGMMTRSRYRALHAEKSTASQTQELLDLILSKRKAELKSEAQASTTKGIDEEDDIDPRIACVICQTEPRTLITWPCKCFAICEGCRVSLVAKGMKGCVCCRQDVEGVSRVFLP